jgi:predicted NodU family carbamoyl transferase
VKARYTLHYTGEKTLDSAVRLLRAGKIVGWFHGATEFGPRALGNRSILASPWAPYVSENLNDYVKHRESFRPFAVSVREEDRARYFKDSPPCRFMNSLAEVHADVERGPVGSRSRPRQLCSALRRLTSQSPSFGRLDTQFHINNARFFCASEPTCSRLMSGQNSSQRKLGGCRADAVKGFAH